ncbi:MAG: hypothetical protein HOA30_08860 [Rhodospirillaceae bacterium]|jgi:hypothetical protein|nr:hypothetical protein [Rhodospirillaceae bacterium]MBT3910020.1 hypothetical protein [Rhodospirillaceae bacterium]MBT5297177.1 hypothetical protein [Rhodospirillaceae bacterium]MBT5514352.1 hypothetical protein [Rhodospirillaceae bacterium]MBT6087038.1 hypothetical protein [Rhodospirillaceae bacterium]
MIKRLFTEHPASVNETYFQHMGMAMGFAVRMFVGALAGLIHAVFPFLCVKTGSGIISTLHHRMVTHRDQSAPESPRAGLGETA